MVGIIAGGLIVLTKVRNWKMTRLNAAFGWTVASVVGFCAIYGSYPIVQVILKVVP